jgi:DNA-directed RNA polymerase specialized sigma24 family protein
MTLPLTEGTCLAKEPLKIDARVLGRAELLAEGDRELIRAVLVHGQSAASVARMMRTPPRTIQARVRRLTRRITSRTFLEAARALPYLSPADAALARMRYCQGATYGDLCRDVKLTLHQVRRNLDRIAAQVETISRISHRGIPSARLEAQAP